MNRLLFLLLPAVVLLLPAISAGASAGDGSSLEAPGRVINLDPILISAKRTFDYDTSRSVPENAVVYTTEDWSLFPSYSVPAFLNYIPGVDVSLGYEFGLASDITIHGSQARQVLVMVDDIPFNTQLSGQSNPSQLPLAASKRIEIIKGAASSAWGSSLGGVVNVITADAGQSPVPMVKLSERFAEYETVQHDLSLSGKTGETGYLLSGSFFDTAGTGTDTDSRKSEFLGKLSQPINDLVRVTGTFGYSGAAVRSEIRRNNRRYFRPYQARYGKFQLEPLQPGDWNYKIAYKFNNQDLTTDTYNILTGQQLGSSVGRHVFHGLSLNTDFRLRADDLLVVGSDFEWQEIKSNNYLNSSKKISIQAPYANYTCRIAPWDFIPGIRFDNNDRFGSQWSPSFGTVYNFSEQTRGRFKVSRAFNAPPLMWIYNDDPAFLVGPNLDLKAERGVQYEWGIETRLERLKIDLSWYWADIKDALSIVYNSDLGLFRAENIRKFRRQGVDLELKYPLSKLWTLFAGGAFNHSVNRTTGQIVRGNGSTRQSFTWGAQYKTQGGLGVNFYGYYKRWDSSAAAEPNDRKPIFDLKITQDLRHLCASADVQLFLNIHNITNSKYWSDISYPLPGRYFEGGFSLQF